MNFLRGALGCFAVVVATLCMAACGGGGGGSGYSLPPPSSSGLPPLPPAVPGKHFTHVVVIVQENRTFDNLFATFSGADGTRTGKTHDGGTIPLKKSDLESKPSPHNGFLFWRRDYNGGAMNGFDTVSVGNLPGTYVYQYVNPAQIKPYWDLAKQYVLSDHTFQTQGSGSFTAHQDLIAGGSQISGTEALVDYPDDRPWGCDAPSGTVTSLINAQNDFQAAAGPFPCLTYRTLRDLLRPANIPWRYYAPQVGYSFGGDLWNAFDAIAAVRGDGKEWGTNVIWPETLIFKELTANTLPSVSWVVPDYANSDHPGNSSDTGPSWVAQVVNAIGESSAWNTTAIVILWDDWGGWYDHVKPPGALRYGGLGFRIPMIVVSPYAKQSYISHKVYQFGSVVRFIEDNWGLPTLGQTDATSADFVNDFFDFSQQPRSFTPIDANYSKAYFESQQPSNKPVDTE